MDIGESESEVRIIVRILYEHWSINADRFKGSIMYITSALWLNSG